MNMSEKKQYRNYIFDLYGTLLDISTDEHDLKMWGILRDFYNAYGCEWKKKRLRDTFFLYDAGERQRLRVTTGVGKPEIKLERVFARLLLEGCPYHASSMKIAGTDIDALRERYKTDIEGVLTLVSASEWATAAANLFRTASRKYIHPYPTTIATLNTLKERGCRLYLLSNAQRIFTMPEIEAFDLQNILDKLYISSDYGMMKPEPDFLKQLMSDEDIIPEETVMVGNEIESDVAIAVRCGIHSIYLNTFDYSKKETNRRIANLLRAEHASEDLTPEIILSGDIAKML